MPAPTPFPHLPDRMTVADEFLQLMDMRWHVEARLTVLRAALAGAGGGLGDQALVDGFVTVLIDVLDDSETIQRAFYVTWNKQCAEEQADA